MIQIENVSFSYGENDENTNGIHNISLHAEQGECVVLCGESGCGKTTVTRLINGLIPHYYEGKLNGRVQVNGADVSKQPLYDTAKVAGSVFQNPRSQFFNVDTTSEITFGCENLGMPEDRIRDNLRETVQAFDISHLMERNIFELSGGQKQKIACAGAFIMKPQVYVLDEPSSNLDAVSIMDLRKTLALWKKQGKTIVISEHRLYYLKDIADRFVYMKNGEIVRDYTAEEFEKLTDDNRKQMGLRNFLLENVRPAVKLPEENSEVELRGFNFSYKGKREREILHITDCKIPANRIVGIIGNNGAGKSTF